MGRGGSIVVNIVSYLTIVLDSDASSIAFPIHDQNKVTQTSSNVSR